MKRRSVGIIAEYNPFHNGHLYHIKESVKMSDAQVSIIAMSGNVVQRGGIPVADKWDRAETAIRCGADIVVEIPAVFACSFAQTFASAGVEILENMGADYISFGSESGNISELKEISRAIKDDHVEIERAIGERARKGLSYPRARRDVISQMYGEDKAVLLDTPNNILAVEYISSMKTATPLTIKRKGCGYKDTDITEGFASAAAIRSMMKNHQDISPYLPEASREIVLRAPDVNMDMLFSLLCQKVLDTDAAVLEHVPAGGEGLGNKIKHVIRQCKNMDQLAQALKSKRYTMTRIDRFLIQTLLSFDRRQKTDNYIRILGISENGGRYIKELKKEGFCNLPLITNINRETETFPGISYSLGRDIFASDLYNILTGRNMYEFSDYVKKPFIYHNCSL